MQPSKIHVVSVIWLAAILFGFFKLYEYEIRPGNRGDASVDFPYDSKIFHSNENPTLILFAHPQCACTRATIGELEKIMAHCQGRVNATVMFLRPNGFSQDWTKSDLWKSASRTPGLRTMIDEEGVECKRFGCVTSGHTLVYDKNGHLVFNGGITSSRGHAGDNAGQEAVLAIILKGRATLRSTQVYGCPLINGPKQKDPIASLINQQWQTKN